MKPTVNDIFPEYPISKRIKDAEFKYAFEEYLNDGSKYFSDYYDYAGILKMKSILRAKKAVFQFYEANMDDNYLEDINL